MRQPRPPRDQPKVLVMAAELLEEPRVGNHEEEEGARCCCRKPTGVF